MKCKNVSEIHKIVSDLNKKILKNFRDGNRDVSISDSFETAEKLKKIEGESLNALSLYLSNSSAVLNQFYSDTFSEQMTDTEGAEFSMFVSGHKDKILTKLTELYKTVQKDNEIGETDTNEPQELVTIEPLYVRSDTGKVILRGLDAFETEVLHESGELKEKLLRRLNALLYDTILIDYENDKLVTTDEVDEQIKKLIEKLSKVDSNEKNEFEQIRSKEDILNFFSANQDTNESKISSYVDYLLASHFDEIITNYFGFMVQPTQTEDGVVYNRVVENNIRQGWVDEDSALNFFSEANELFKSLIENTSYKQNGKDIYLKYIPTVFAMMEIKMHPDYKGNNPIEEIRDILQKLSEDDSNKNKETFRAIYNKYFASSNSLYALSKQPEAQKDMELQNLINAFSLSLISGVPAHYVSVENGDVVAPDFQATTPTKNSLSSMFIENIINNNINIDEENDVLTISNSNTEGEIRIKDFNTKNYKLYINDELVESNNLTEDQLKTLAKVFIDSATDSSVINPQYITDKIRITKKLLKDSINKINDLKEALEVYQEYELEGIAEDEEALTEVINILKSNEISKSATAQLEKIEDDLDYFNVYKSLLENEFVELFEGYATAYDQQLQVTQKATKQNIEGNNVPRITVNNIMSNYNAYFNNLRENKESVFKDNPFITNELIEAVAIQQGVKTTDSRGRVEVKPHTRFSSLEAFTYNFEYMFYKMMLNNSNVGINVMDPSDKSTDFIIFPKESFKHKGKTYTEFFKLQDTVEDFESTTKEIQNVFLQTQKDYYNNVVNQLLADYSQALNKEFTNLKSLQTALNKLDAEEVKSKFNIENIPFYNTFHFETIKDGKIQLNSTLQEFHKIFNNKSKSKKFLKEQYDNSIEMLKQSGYVKEEDGKLEFDISNSILNDIKERLGVDDDFDEDKLKELLFQRYTNAWQLVSLNFNTAVIGGIHQYKDKSKGANSISARFTEQIKRSVIPGASFYPYMLGLDFGVEDFTRTAVVSDPKHKIFNILGSEIDYERYDGASWEFEELMIKEQNSLGGTFGYQAGPHQKSIGKPFDAKRGVTTLVKHAAHKVSNERIRETRGLGDDKIDLYEVKKKAFDAPYFESFVPDQDMIDRVGTFYVYNPDTGVVEERQLEAKAYNSPFELWEALGGENTVKVDSNGAIEYNGVSYSYTVNGVGHSSYNMVLLEGLDHIRKGRGNDSIKGKYIGRISFESAVKTGAANVNPAEALLGKSKAKLLYLSEKFIETDKSPIVVDDEVIDVTTNTSLEKLEEKINAEINLKIIDAIGEEKYLANEPTTDEDKLLEIQIIEEGNEKLERLKQKLNDLKQQTQEFRKGDIVTPDMIIKDDLSETDGEFVGDIIEEGNKQGKNTKIIKINGTSERGVSADIRVVTNDGVIIKTVFLKQPDVQKNLQQPNLEQFIKDNEQLFLDAETIEADAATLALIASLVKTEYDKELDKIQEIAKDDPDSAAGLMMGWDYDEPRLRSELKYIEYSNQYMGIQLNAGKNIEDKPNKFKTVTLPTQLFNALAFSGHEADLAREVYETLAELSTAQVQEYLNEIGNTQTTANIRKKVNELLFQRLKTRGVQSNALKILKATQEFDGEAFDNRQINSLIVSVVNSFFDSNNIKIKIPGTEFIVSSNTIEIFDALVDGKPRTVTNGEIKKLKLQGRQVEIKDGPRPLKQQETIYNYVGQDGEVKQLNSRLLPEALELKEVAKQIKASKNQSEIKKLKEEFRAKRYKLQQVLNRIKDTGKITINNTEYDIISIDENPAEIGIGLTRKNVFGIKTGQYLSEIDTNHFIEAVRKHKHLKNALVERLLESNELGDDEIYVRTLLNKFNSIEKEFRQAIEIGSDQQAVESLIKAGFITDGQLITEEELIKEREELIKSLEQEIVRLYQIYNQDPDAKSKNWRTVYNQIKAAETKLSYAKDFSNIPQLVQETNQNIQDALQEAVRVVQAIITTKANYVAEIEASWNEYLNQIGGRIPGQDYQSIMAMKVAHIFHTEENTIVLPTESKWYKGEDEDIDKEPVIQYYINPDAVIQGWTDNFDPTDKSTWTGTLTNPTPEAFTNKLVYLFNQIMKSSKNQIVREADMNMDEPAAAAKRAENTPKGKLVNLMSPFNPVARDEMYTANMIGKEVIGIMATALKAYSGLTIAYNSNITDPEQAKYLKIINGDKKFTFNGKIYETLSNINLERFNNEDIAKVAEFLDAFKPEGSVDEIAEQIKEYYGTQVSSSYVLSQLLSAATDNAKELILGKINVTPLTAGIYSTLISMGVDFDEIVKFFEHPDIESVIKQSSKNIFKSGQYKAPDDVAREMLEEGKGDKRVLQDFINAYKASKGYRLLGKLYGLNQGLPNDAQAMYNYIDSIESFMAKEYEMPFDFIRFVKDENYKQSKIDEFNNIRVGYNVLWALNQSPHFMSYATILTISDDILNTTSNKYRFTKELLKQLERNGYLPKTASQKAKDDAFRKVNDYINLIYPQLFLAVEKPVVIINDEEFNLNNVDDQNEFIKKVNNYYIPYLKKFEKTKNNGFVKILTKESYKEKGVTKSAYKPLIDLTNVSDEISNILMLIKTSEFNQLNAIEDENGNNVFKVLQYYNMLVHNDALTKRSFSRFYPLNQPIRDYLNFEAGLTNQADIISNQFEIDELVLLQKLEYKMTKKEFNLASQEKDSKAKKELLAMLPKYVSYNKQVYENNGEYLEEYDALPQGVSVNNVPQKSKPKQPVVQPEFTTSISLDRNSNMLQQINTILELGGSIEINGNVLRKKDLEYYSQSVLEQFIDENCGTELYDELPF